MTDEPRSIAESLRDWRKTPEPTRERVARYDELDPDDGELATWRAESLEIMNQRRWHAAVPQRFHRADLSDFAGARWFPSVIEWATPPETRNLCILGAVGIGKSHLAAAACRQACEGSLEVKMLTAARILDLLRPGGPEGALDALLDVSRLVIDDVGADRPTDWSMERLALLVDERWAENQATVFTSNLSPKDLEVHVGPRAFSRMVSGVNVLLEGFDRRRA